MAISGVPEAALLLLTVVRVNPTTIQNYAAEQFVHAQWFGHSVRHFVVVTCDFFHETWDIFGRVSAGCEHVRMNDHFVGA